MVAVIGAAATMAGPPNDAAGAEPAVAEPQRGATTRPTIKPSRQVAEPTAPTVEAAATPGVAPDDQVQAIDLPTALRLADAQNPQVRFAQERICEALAQYQAARTLWLPSVRGGASWNHHEGSIQETVGRVLNVSRSDLYTGAGAQAIGSGSPIVPGVFANFHAADAIFQPKAARQAVQASRSAARATSNDVLLEVAFAYLDLLRTVYDAAIAEEARSNAQKLADLTASFARSGEGLQADADRAATALAIRENGVRQSFEAVSVASARLAQLLRLDPTLPLEPIDEVVPIQLVSEREPTRELVAMGLGTRPELAEIQRLVAQARYRLKREQLAPLIPSAILGMSYGGFGGGEGRDVRNFDDRFDFDLGAYWEVRNLGFGDRAARRQRRSRLRQTRIREVALMDRVAREIVEAAAQVHARRPQIATAADGVREAVSSYERNQNRIQAGQGLPIEVLQSIDALALMRREYLRAVIDYNRAQFALHRALGWPSEPGALERDRSKAAALGNPSAAPIVGTQAPQPSPQDRVEP